MSAKTSTSAPDIRASDLSGTNGPAWHQAAEAGWDMTLLAESMRLTMWERIQHHRAALSLASMLREAVVNQHA
jgi:hypothetical protein